MADFIRLRQPDIDATLDRHPTLDRGSAEQIEQLGEAGHTRPEIGTAIGTPDEHASSGHTAGGRATKRHVNARSRTER